MNLLDIHECPGYLGNMQRYSPDISESPGYSGPMKRKSPGYLEPMKHKSPVYLRMGQGLQNTYRLYIC